MFNLSFLPFPIQFNTSRPDLASVGGSSNSSLQTPIHSISNSEFVNTCGLDVIDLNNDEIKEIPLESVHYWKWEEDEILISAWLNVSTGPVVGTKEKGDWGEFLIVGALRCIIVVFLICVTKENYPPSLKISNRPPPKLLVPNHHQSPSLPPGGKVCECVVVRVAHVGVLTGDGDGDKEGDVGTGLVSVEGNSAPGRQRRGRQRVNLRRKEGSP
ncbi:hypothetical protein PIB30_025155 [Stylosanthes scabra]|uniref:Uncharacterized protein n=1 Tax=Stylosanthes scabra TaxID=79078 RepID=A0ABU6YC53_9FABA|nr:hypothetical protein [Stylosanthes scabra]